VRLVDPWRTSPLLWTVGVILFTPLIVGVGLFVVAATVAGGLWHGAHRTRVSPNAGAALKLAPGAARKLSPGRAHVLGLKLSPGLAPIRPPQRSPGLSPVRPLRPSPADKLETAATFSHAA
jgi:hypothetical protein